MMLLHCNELGKRYNRHWVFRNLSAEFSLGDAVAITGNNGSGKSTLLKVLAGFERFSEGKFEASLEGKLLDENSLYKYVALCAPYQNLYEDFTMQEHFDLHCGFKKMRVENFKSFSDLIELENVFQKPLKHYSSGMRQRVKLALAILSDTPILLLDEPVSNLDSRSVEWYKKLVANHLQNRIVFVASNVNPDEMFFCSRTIQVHDYQ